jgi:glucose/arabinose dehydrogenase
VTSKQVIVPDLPTGGNHTTHTVLVGSDGNLYVSIGSTCNVCMESDPHRMAVWVYHWMVVEVGCMLVACAMLSAWRSTLGTSKSG